MKPEGHTWQQYVRNGLGLKLSRLGEFLGVDWLTYNQVIFEQFHSMALSNAPIIIDAVVNAFPTCRRFVDIGAGSGAFAAEFKRRGFDVQACEYSQRGRRLSASQGLACQPFDLRNNPPAAVNGPIDLAYSFEVAEHLPRQLGDALVDYLCTCSDSVVFSAAQPGQGGVGHINEQPPDYWIARFEAQRFRLETREE